MAVGSVSILGRFANGILQGLIPMSVARQQAFFADSWLADVEADHDQWEPDELWAARHKTSAGGDSPSLARGTAPNLGLPPVLSLVQPAAATPQAGAFSSGGRHSKTDHRTDEQVIEELVEDFRAFITDCFDKRFRN